MSERCSCFEIVYCKLLILLHCDSTMFFIISIFEWCWKFFSKAPGCCLWGGAETSRIEFGAEWLEKPRCSLPRKQVRRFSPIILCFLFCYPILWSGFLWDTTVLHFNILNTLASGVFLLKDDSRIRTETCNQLLYSCRWKKPPVPLGLIDKASRLSYSNAANFMSEGNSWWSGFMERWR